MGLLGKAIKAGRTLMGADVRWIRALSRGVAPSLEHVPVLKRLQLAMVVDIGANRGQFALAARHCFPEAIIMSFEPLSRPAGIFRKVFARDTQVTLHELAIGPKAEQSMIHVSARDDSSSLLPITERQNALFPGTAEAMQQNIQVTPLDAVLTPGDIAEPALLKLDVQGFELQALEGCESLLHRFAWIYAECSFVELYEGQALADEVIAWLQERGFKLSGVYNMSYDREGKAVQADFLFAQNPKAG